MLATGVLVLAGAGTLMLAGTGTASARPATSTACENVVKAFQSIDSTLETKHGTLKADVALISSKLTKAASTGSPALKTDVQTLITDLEAGAADPSGFDSAKLTADDDAIVAACAASNTPVGAPATGGGSTAGLQDPALFGLGGAAVLAGVVVLGLAVRNRVRTRVGPVGHG
jgi:hypothetical protein